MRPGSIMAGDTLINGLGIMRVMSAEPILAKYGTKWTFDFASDEALIAQLADVSLRDARVQSLHAMGAHAPREADEHDEVCSDADKMAQFLSAVASWPPQAIEWIRPRLVEENGAENIVREMVEDKMGFHGLKEKTAKHKAAVCKLLFADGRAAELSVAVNELPAAAPKSMMTKVYDTLLMMYMMYKMKRGVTISYSLYVAKKA